MNKTKWLIVAAVLLVIIGTAIGTFTGRVVDPQASEPLTIGVAVYPGFAPFFIAEEKGFFEQEGVNANVIINDFSQSISSIASNNAQLVFSTADLTTVIVDSGVDVKEIFATDIGYGYDGLLVTKEINSIADLKGKTVHLLLGSPSHFLFRVLAEEAGLEKDDVTLVQMDAEQVGAAFVAGHIDYGMSWEPWLSVVSQREGGKVLVSSRDKPGIITDTFVVRTDVLESRRDDVKAVIRAWFDAIEFWKSNPDEANAIMARNFGLSVEDFEAQVATVKFLDYEESLARFDRSTELNIFELTEKAVEIFREDGIIESDIDPEEIIDVSVLDELYE